MNIEQFILTMGSLVLVNDLVVQTIKEKFTNKHTTLIAFITAIILTFLGLYFKLYNFDIITTTVLGFAVGLFGTSGYDKVKKCYDSILGLIGK